MKPNILNRFIAKHYRPGHIKRGAVPQPRQKKKQVAVPLAALSVATIIVFTKCNTIAATHRERERAWCGRCSMKYRNWEISELFRNSMHEISELQYKEKLKYVLN